MKKFIADVSILLKISETDAETIHNERFKDKDCSMDMQM